MSEWQPIETAPKDGRFILIACVDSFGQYVHVPIGVQWLIGWWAAPGRVAHRAWEPTHWMPLPEPPQ